MIIVIELTMLGSEWVAFQMQILAIIRAAACIFEPSEVIYHFIVGYCEHYEYLLSNLLVDIRVILLAGVGLGAGFCLRLGMEQIIAINLHSWVIESADL